MKNITNTIKYGAFIFLVLVSGARLAHASCQTDSVIVSFCDTPNSDDDNGDDDNGNNDLNVDTWSASNVDSDSATLRGEIVDLNENHDYTRYFEWGTSSGDLNHTTTISGTTSSTGTFSRTISGLNDNDTYYFRACADDEDSSDSDCGSIRSFTTDSDNSDDDNSDDDDSSVSSNVITTDATGITTNSAVLNGLVINESGSQTVWFEWGTTVNLGHTTSSRTVSGNESFVSTGLYGLSSNQVYFFRLVSSNGDRGDFKSFITNRVVSSGGNTTVIVHEQTNTQTNNNTALGPLFLDVNLVADVKEAGPGDIVNFTASYENLTGYTLKSVRIIVDFDEGINIIKSDAGTMVGDNNIELDIPELSGHAKGEFHISTSIDKKASRKIILVSTIEGNHLNPTMANSWVDTVDYSAIKVIASRTNLSANALFAGFFPHSFLGWLLIALIIFLIILIVRKMQKDNEDRKDHLKIIKQ